MTAGKLIELLSMLPIDMTVYIADNVSCSDDESLSLEPITESCEDKTPIAYVMCDKTIRRSFSIEVD